MTVGTNITKQNVIDVYEYRKKYGNTMHNKDIAKLCDIGESTVGKILSGKYDHLLKEPSSSNTALNSSELNNILELLYTINNNIQSDNEEFLKQLANIGKELQSIGDLLHIVAICLMRQETDKVNKSKMAAQIQAVHTNQRISDALK